MLTVNSSVRDLGTIKFGEPQSFDWEITNSSDELITIKDIILSCKSCTEASLSKRVLFSNEKTILSIIYTPGALGLSSKHLDVVYEMNNSNHLIKFSFKAIIHG